MRRSLWNGLLGLILVLACGCGGGGDDDDATGVVQFAAATFTVSEDGSAIAAVTVRRAGGADGAASVTITLTDGTATGGPPPLASPVDYDNTPIVITFASGDGADKVANVPILDDLDSEPNETVNLALGSPTGAPLGSQVTAVLVIANNDNPGTLSLTAPTYAYTEAGSPVNAITVRRTGGASGPVSVTVTSSDGTANSDPASNVEPVDYTPVNTTVTFLDQDTQDKILTPPVIADDVLPEIDETFSVTLSTPTGGANLGAEASATVTIMDGDTVLTASNPSPAAQEEFGAAVSRAGGRIAVGVPGQALAGANGAGEVDVFDAASGNFLGAIPNPTGIPGQCCQSARFGAALSAAGNGVLIGSPSSGVGALNGAGYIYDAASFALRLAVFSSPTIGYASAVSFLPGTFAIGAFADGAGSVRFYDSATGALLQTILGPGPQPEQFGKALAATGPNLLVGAPDADVLFTDSGRVSLLDGTSGALLLTIPNPFPASADHFGTALAPVGTEIVVGTPDDDAAFVDAGTVYVFNGTSGAYIRSLSAPVPVASGRFGAQVAVVRNRLAVQHQAGGTGGAGEILIYDALGSLVQTIAHPSPQTGADFGAAMAEFDGALIVGAPLQDVGGQADVGVVFVFKVN